MITIRYSDLPEGLHAQAMVCGRQTVIYLRRGLTPEERRRGLRRAMQSARMGYGPRLPVSGVAFALVRDALLSTLRNAVAALRTHPAGSAALAAGMVASLACYGVVVTASLRFMAMPKHPLGNQPVAVEPGRVDLRGRIPAGMPITPTGTPVPRHSQIATAPLPGHHHPRPSGSAKPSRTPSRTGPSPGHTGTPTPSTTTPTPPHTPAPATSPPVTPPVTTTPTAGCPLLLCLGSN